MKKTSCILMALCICLCCTVLFGCGGSNRVKVVCPEGKAELCDDGVVEYLNAEEGADVSFYYVEGDTVGKPVEINWGSAVKGLLGYTLEYATRKDFSDKISVELPADREWYDLYNLYKGTKYYVRVWAHNGKNKYYAQSSFTTTDRGPRVMTVDGTFNMRDIGGYAANGKKVKQGMVYRGAALNGEGNDDGFEIAITRDGKKYMKEQMGIKSEISLLGGYDGISTLGADIPMYTFRISGYADAFKPTQAGKIDFTEQYRALFSRLAQPETYPTYIHCQGGADRTGTVCYLLNALLGVGQRDLTYDYEFTSFSMLAEIGVRSTVSGYAAPLFKEMNDRLNAFEGDSLMSKTENYLLSIGVTAQEIASIRSLLLV